jgi:hypothetical protein
MKGARRECRNRRAGVRIDTDMAGVTAPSYCHRPGSRARSTACLRVLAESFTHTF